MTHHPSLPRSVDGLPHNASRPMLFSERWILCALAVAFVAFYLLPLMTHGLWIPDETRYAQISQEMLLSGNWVSPHFMGIRYFEKPIAGYWMIAIGQAVFGDNLFGVRIASALSTGLSVWLVYLISRRLWNDPRKSFACALFYMSFGLIAGQAGYANPGPAVYALGQFEPGHCCGSPSTVARAVVGWGPGRCWALPAAWAS